MRLRHTLAFVALCIATWMATVAPVPALAGGGNLATRVDGSFADAKGEGTFEGTFTLTGFTREGDRLFARGTLDGTLTDGAGKTLAEVTDRSITLAVDATELVATCELAKLVLTGAEVEASGVKVELQPVQVEIAANAVPAHRLEGPLCDLAKAIDQPGELDTVARQLDRVLAALE